MTLDQINTANNLQFAFETFMAFANAVVYTIVFVWVYRFLRLIEKTSYTWILYYFMSISAVFVILFGYVFLTHIIGEPLRLTPYGALLIRPVIFLMGCGIASLFKIITIMKISGRNTWTLRKPKA